MFELFNQSIIKAIFLAEEETRKQGYKFVGTEQLLLGILLEEESLAAKALKDHAVSFDNASQEVWRVIGSGGKGTAELQLPFTPRAKRVLELAWDEAKQLQHSYIGCEHLLLGLIRDNDGIAIQVLKTLGVNLVSLRSEILDSCR